MGRRGGWLLAVMLLWGLAAWGAGAPTEPPEESWLSLSKPNREKPPVRFSHRRHPKAVMACETCHHRYEGKRNRWREGQPVEKCQTCHRLQPEKGLLDAQNAFHQQCKGCHLARRKLRQPAGPITCEGCHQPRKAVGG
ncbi:MAG: cytochrome c3 family protein [Desulfobaccales bacterium]